MSRINATAEQTQQGARVPLHRSLFKMQQNLYLTNRFGEYSPFWSFDSFEADRIRQRSITTTRSLSLGAPLMEDITNKRDYFQVYYDAILPFNWEKLLITPKKGDDVDWDEVGCFVNEFPKKIGQMCSGIWYWFSSEVSGFSDSELVSYFLRKMTFTEMFYSDGALLNYFGCHMSNCATFRFQDTGGIWHQGLPFDKVFDQACQVILMGGASANMYATVEGQPDLSTVPIVTAADLRYVLDLFREYGNKVTVTASLTNAQKTFLQNVQATNFNTTVNWHMNLAPVWAYQMVCAHFYSNDNVDYIYSANLFRELIGNYVSGFSLESEGISAFQFLYNGVSYFYDYLSAFYFNKIVSSIVEDSGALSDVSDSYFRTLFTFRRSLRFMDYFGGARTQPLAVGDTDVAVNDNKVSVIDITQRIQAQRLLNNINRLPQQIDGFIKGLVGKDQSFDYHNPGWLAHTTDTVFAAEVENTGEAQQRDPNSVTATLRGKSSTKEFQFESDRPCILLGVQYFDIRRAYFTGVRRTLQYSSRYDMFTPELQYIGDQPILKSELVSGNTSVDKYFGYTEQYNWFKMTYDEALGGFVSGSLPGWAFLFEPKIFRAGLGIDFHISPNFIRSVPQELDKYFLSLTGFSLGTYFHFQQKVVNLTDASRPMVKHAQILG